ncbi:bifunctional 23S rRNA (guanine(2069)-N(7))-methyltransferase RlmK/23S rRNA (guanine(2445)-N(2))-methyltransferase RlmL [Neptunicella marina]|uniref:Ribosomal RNA large subunit methyltransferase K/L n=1 Tax=Neptunicella marina TaxID=2125989 RepID=A0A8J6IY67_9ALTE|nr:bifunctional 23S rRNA (guanine(2069)-N(7))-methyltransferase RlmK/23S rRNA (guanine(2445)-N(2))-methyltransferase RlmL [Neptunicella marina]MBC3767507.1 bifunctional 23S rRNA (guanine(2069)-N(7))-methyltransferase RlmK/23S rRNA (guanine(2445)-N(2))-methyltransferase RlmL [Neptunicella marina]
MFDLVITSAKGIDDLLLQEVQTICPDLQIKVKPGQLHFTGSLEHAYKICLHSRLANRVLVKLASGTVDKAEDVYTIADSVNWGQHFDVHHTFIVDFNGTNRSINNSQFGALKIKDAVVDQFNSLYGKRPSISKVYPDIRIQGRLWKGELTIFLDLSGHSLHQRHYRKNTGPAPLKEHLASAMLMRSGWAASSDAPLYDPMCGSGTIVIEAAMMAANIPPGLRRRSWGFSQWRQHDSSIWSQLVNDAEQAIVAPDKLIIGSDIDAQMIEVAKVNAEQAGVADYIQFSQADAFESVPDVNKAGYLVSNPPFGERLSEITALIPKFEVWGKHIKQHFAHWHLSLLTSNRELLRALRLRAKKAYQLMNGKLECQLVNYVMDESNCEIREVDTNNDFTNRLSKNWQKTQKWLKKQRTNCFRVYDADLPEYNVAIDCYADAVVIQEYAAPKDIPEAKTRQRLHQVIAGVPAVLNCDAEKIVLKVREQQKGKQQYQKLAQRKEFFEVVENGARLWVNLRDYLDTGLFLDHRTTRHLVQQKAAGKHVLNLFAYTGSVSVHAAIGKASSVTTVDMSNTYLDWAKRNFELNNLKGQQYQFIQADCLNWLAEHKSQYDLIFIDPPSFSNSKRMDQSWDVQRDHLALLENAKACLKPGGEIIFSNNLRSFKLDTAGLEQLGFKVTDWCQKTLPEDFKRNPKIHHCWLLTDAN